MSLRKDAEPIFDRKVKHVLEGLANGKTRAELAAELDYANPVSLDNYMRRHNFAWDGKMGTFVPANEKYAEKEEALELEVNTKAGAVVLEFRKLGGDAKQVAKNLGFPDHHSLGKYMAKMGYMWDSDISNYRKTTEGYDDSSVETSDSPVAVTKPLPEEKYSATFVVVPQTDIIRSSPANGPDLTQYIPVLELLIQNSDRLRSLLEASVEKGRFPRYSISGSVKPKTVQLPVRLTLAVEKYATLCNISQRTLFEIALVDFLQKYGEPSDYHNVLLE